jgi:hypothetical protein
MYLAERGRPLRVERPLRSRTARKGTIVNYAAALLGSAPGELRAKLGLALLRALRTLIQGVAASLLTAFPGQTLFDVSYVEAFGFSVLAAAITALASFLQNVAGILPSDPTQAVPQ